MGQNARRATFSRGALDDYMKTTGLTIADGLDTAIGDLLVDLMHLCDQEGLDFAEILERASGHHEAENAVTCSKCKRKFDMDMDSGDDKATICSECAKA